MSTLKDTLKNAFYLSVGAVAYSIEAVADAATVLIAKGEETVEKGKVIFSEFREKNSFPDDEEPAVVIEEAPIED